MKYEKSEFIAKEAEVVESSNKKNVGIRGKIIDETKNMFLIKTKDGVKKLAKKESVFEIAFDNRKVRIEGKKIAKRPEDRIKI